MPLFIQYTHTFGQDFVAAISTQAVTEDFNAGVVVSPCLDRLTPGRSSSTAMHSLSTDVLHKHSWEQKTADVSWTTCRHPVTGAGPTSVI